MDWTWKHWIWTIALVLIGYFIGVYYPGPGSRIASKVTG